MSEHDKLEPHILKKFDVVRKIGSGAYGIVWKVIDRRTQRVFALKKNFDAFQNPTDAQRTYRQIMFLQELQHPNIVKLKQVIRAQNNKDIYLLFEFMYVDLYFLIRENKLGDDHKRYIAYQVAKAMHYIHTAELIHRDIKPSNILINEDCLAKICDFGLVRSLEGEGDINMTEYIATRWYRAPEILLSSKQYSKAADVWSFGCLLGELMRGKPMFPGSSTLNQIERIVNWTGPPTMQQLQALKTPFGKAMQEILSKIKLHSHKEWFTNCSPQCLDLITRSLMINPEKRLTMIQILKHPYLRDFYDRDRIIEAPKKIRVLVDDKQKLSLKDYRALIYKQIEEIQEKNSIGGLGDSCIEKGSRGDSRGDKCEKNSSMDKGDAYQAEQYEQANKTLYKNRLQKALVRSASKNKQQSVPRSNQKQSNTVSIKKKYESLLGKVRDEMTRTKYVKTEEKQQKGSLPKRKKSDHIMKYYTNEKKKKSVSLYDGAGTRDSEIIAKYMYEHRNL